MIKMELESQLSMKRLHYEDDYISPEVRSAMKPTLVEYLIPILGYNNYRNRVDSLRGIFNGSKFMMQYQEFDKEKESNSLRLACVHGLEILAVTIHTLGSLLYYS